MLDKNQVQIKEDDLILVFGEIVTRYYAGELITKWGTSIDQVLDLDLEIIGNMLTDSEKFTTLSEEDKCERDRVELLKRHILEALS